MPERATRFILSTAALWVWSLSSATAFAQVTGNDAWDEDDILIARVIIVTLIVAIYTLPSIVAFARGHANRWAILGINIVFGGTGIGWLGSLIWACSAVHRSATGSNGGESGLNIFVNDPQPVTISNVASPPMPAPVHSMANSPVNVDEIADRLKRISSLYAAGAITEVEHASMRAAVLQGI